jgi:hypothetical protein
LGEYHTLAAQGGKDPWALLAQHDSLLRKDIVGTEEVIDLVLPWVTDSVVEAPRERLKGFGGWIAQRTWSRYWEYYTSHKQKYVGTSSHEYHVFNGPGDEMDINIFLMPHLKRYVSMVKLGFDASVGRGRNDKGYRFHQPEGYPLPEELKYQDRGYLSVECEVTPPQQFAELLNKDFFPTNEGVYVIDSLSNFGTKYPTVGMTGVWCMDCNHNCRPEIHPFEWLWWLDMSDSRPGSSYAKSWMVALMVDDSHRFKNWSLSPLSGEIAIPFVVPSVSRSILVDLHNVGGNPVDDIGGIQVSEDMFQSGDTSFVIPISASPELNVDMRTTGNWPRAGTRYWISDLRPGPLGWTGYVHVATTVQNLLALRVTIDCKLP